MIIENHSGIFRVDKRLRSVGDIKLPGDGITYAQLKGGLIGAVLVAPIVFALQLILPNITPTIGFIPGTVVGWLAVIGIGIGGIVIAARFVGSRSDDGVSVSDRFIGWLSYRMRAPHIADGEYFRASDRTVIVTANVRIR